MASTTGGVPLSQVNCRCQGNHGADELVVAVNAFYGRELEHAPVVKNPLPELTVDSLQPIELSVMDQQHAAAVRAGVKQRFDAVLGPAAQAPVDQFSAGLGDQVRPDFFRELVVSHEVIFSIPPMYGLSASGMTTVPSSC